jgi:hypothetical protein
MYYGIDAAVKYSFMNLINSKVVDPSHLWWLYFFGTLFWNSKPRCWFNFWFTENVDSHRLQRSFGDREILQEPDNQLIFNIQQVLLSNLEEKILTVMESTIKRMLVQKLLIKSSTVVLTRDGDGI